MEATAQACCLVHEGVNGFVRSFGAQAGAPSAYPCMSAKKTHERVIFVWPSGRRRYMRPKHAVWSTNIGSKDRKMRGSTIRTS
eukprot:5932093-Prymnesium_polylepis.2